jgi:hypothetical protein
MPLREHVPEALHAPAQPLGCQNQNQPLARINKIPVSYLDKHCIASGTKTFLEV